MSRSLLQDPTELRRRFLTLESPSEIAALLDVSPSTLRFHLYVAMPKDKYSEFHIPKKMGGKRTILAPVSSLKIIQAKLAQVLQAVYIPRATVHGFTLNRSILTNARLHANKRWVFNVDIEEFFPSINFGRVRGMFSSPPYSLPPNVATVLAQIACFSNQLPQGAPTSPIISNMICSKLDSQLRRLAIESRCVYTRYADDLTLSTTLRRFPGNLATLTDTGSVEAGPQLVQLIAQNGFTLNIAKARLQSQHQRQEVTGLTTNLFPNIQRRYLHQVRAMLHDWKRHGEVIAFQRHFALEPYRRREGTTATAFHSIVKGKIDFLGMIKGRNDPSYRKFLYEYAGLNPDFILPKEPLPPPPPDTRQAFVFTEGKTDWMHLEAALKRLHHHSKFKDVHLIFDKDTPQPGNKNLLAMCKTFARTPTPYPVPYIFLFDRDDPGILRDANLDKADIHEWGANVFSVAIPIPPHRPAQFPLCIEFLYKDEDLLRPDKQHRRLFLSTEFHLETGWHVNELLTYPYPRKFSPGRISIVDNDVFDRRNVNVALPKTQFASHVLNEEPGFAEPDISGFEPLFDMLQAILFG